MLGDKLEEYEEALEKHISRLEDDISHRQIQLGAGIKLEITANQSVEAVKHKLNNDILSITKKIDNIEFDSLHDKAEKAENVEELKSDADLVVSILKKKSKNREKEENILREKLEEIKKELNSILLTKSTLKATDQYSQVQIIKCQNEILKIINMKALQDLYIGRLRSDIVYAELGVGSLVEVMTNISQKSKTSFVKFSELLKTLKKFAEPQSNEIKQWENCLTFAIYENNLRSSRFIKQNDTVDLEVTEIKKFVMFNYQNNVSDKQCNFYRDKLLIIRNYLYHQKEYNSALKLRFIGSKIRNRSLSSQILSHSDPIQEKLFQAELKTEIRKFLCAKLMNFFNQSTSIQTTISNHELQNPDFSLVNVQLFLTDSRASDLLTNCQKQRKLFIISERKRAALFFRCQRLRDEVKEVRISNEILVNQRKNLEHKLFEAESKHDPLFSLQTEDTNLIETKENQKLNLEKMIEDNRLEKENLENETNLLSQKLEEIYKNCDEFRQKTGSLSYYQKKNEDFNQALQKITLLLAERHELLNKQYQIQQKLKAIISRRDCAFTSLTNSIQNRETVDSFTFKTESFKDLTMSVQDLKKQVKEKRERLMKFGTL